MLNNKKLFFLFCIFLLIFISNFAFIRNVYAIDYNIVFITDPQNIVLNQISDPITIQVQDSTGSIIEAPEQIYLNLQSSGNGEFSSNNESWSIFSTLSDDFSTSTIYMRTGTSKRTFYYKGLSIGEHNIKVYAKTKSGISLNVINQNINIISESSSTSTSSNACTSFTYSSWGSCSNNIQTRTVSSSLPSGCSGGTPEIIRSCSSTSTFVNQTASVVTKIIYVSTHSDEEDLSNYNDKTPFEVTSGRERMALVGSPIKFEAKYNLSQNNQCSPVFKWSYGDGFEDISKQVSHIYKFPGEYQVVLNGTCGEYNSVSRTVVKVIEPNISVTGLSTGDIEIINNVETEINIGDYKIIGVPKIFTFAQDTIITSKNKIILSKDDLGNNTSTTTEVFLMNPSGRQVAHYSSLINNEIEQTNLTLSSTTNSQKVLSNIKSTSTTKVLSKTSVGGIFGNQKESEKKLENIANIDLKQYVEENNLNQTASVAVATASSKTGFWSKLAHKPINGIKYFINKFYDF